MLAPLIVLCVLAIYEPDADHGFPQTSRHDRGISENDIVPNRSSHNGVAV